VILGGVSWTKFELFTNKIRRILKTSARAERVVALGFLLRSGGAITLACARLALLPVAYKTKNFLTNPFKRRGVQGGAAKK